MRERIAFKTGKLACFGTGQSLLCELKPAGLLGSKKLDMAKLRFEARFWLLLAFMAAAATATDLTVPGFSLGALTSNADYNTKVQGICDTIGLCLPTKGKLRSTVIATKRVHCVQAQSYHTA